MKKHILMGCLLLLQLAVTAQEITIRDQETREPLAFATIFDAKSNTVTNTDGKGRAEMRDFINSEEIEIQLIGYKHIHTSYEELEQQGFEVLMEPAGLSLDEVVVSAVRWAQERRDVPHKVTTIRPLDVALQNPQTMADLLETSGEIYVQKSQLGGGSPMLRGFATNRILLVVDGVRMNTAIFRSGNLQNVISLDPFATEQTEVIFGPGSVIYGSDAIGGVLSFSSMAPKFGKSNETFIKGSAALRYATANNEKTAHADVNIGWEKWALLSSFTYSDFGDLRMGSNGPDKYLRPEYVKVSAGGDQVVDNPDPLVQVPTGYSQYNLMQKVRFQPNSNWDLNYSFHYSASSNVPRYDRLIEYSGGGLRSAEWYYGPQEWMMNNLNISHTGSGIYDHLRLTLAQQHFEESRHDRRWGRTQLRHRYEAVEVISANLDLEKSFSEKSQLFYGLEMLLNTVGSTGQSEDIETGATQAVSTRYPDGSTWNSYAAYMNWRYRLHPKLSVLTGARYNLVKVAATFDDTFFPLPFPTAELSPDALNGSIGLAYQPDPTWQINANISTGFRAPNIDDLGKIFDSEPGAVIVPNPDLRPEYAVNTELGFIKTIDEKVKVDVTAYYTQLRDALVRREFRLNGQDSIEYDGVQSRVLAIQNAAEATVWGIQAGIELKLPGGFGLNSRFNYQHGEEELDNGDTAPLRHAAPWFGVTHLTYKYKRLKADLYAIYNGEVANDELAPSEQEKTDLYTADENGNPYSPAWTTLNLKMNYGIGDGLLLGLGLENILDKRYRPYSSGITAPGRNLIVSARLQF
ncbi:TonB-dependent receptor [Flavilitoribacter nigricans]|uniref:TonB-dependent receptor n=1 Tax=Flavilitoribacter nigricans (strain ATCC 23147 / DSM 23189 / NBRC 102662 / NCIMB 1420 / SS-2) TaxID=1122177 RepID=A0A2D0MY61_FLAN2|nr:TonB-dependent receptor [Flavilitoribacter nigricans]PHN01204.1 TonB-dependent receptor [Flavilitoribacter nigricans DSM 23189 = NBRC 102662]